MSNLITSIRAEPVERGGVVFIDQNGQEVSAAIQADHIVIYGHDCTRPRQGPDLWSSNSPRSMSLL